MRVDFSPGVAFGRHTHPGEEIVYVLEGSLGYEVDGKAPVTLKAGGVLFIPAGTIHSAKNVGSGNGAELATYLVEGEAAGNDGQVSRWRSYEGVVDTFVR